MGDQTDDLAQMKDDQVNDTKNKLTPEVARNTLNPSRPLSSSNSPMSTMTREFASVDLRHASFLTHRSCENLLNYPLSLTRDRSSSSPIAPISPTPYPHCHVRITQTSSEGDISSLYSPSASPAQILTSDSTSPSTQPLRARRFLNFQHALSPVSPLNVAEAAPGSPSSRRRLNRGSGSLHTSNKENHCNPQQPQSARGRVEKVESSADEFARTIGEAKELCASEPNSTRGPEKKSKNSVPSSPTRLSLSKSMDTFLPDLDRNSMSAPNLMLSTMYDDLTVGSPTGKKSAIKNKFINRLLCSTSSLPDMGFIEHLETPPILPVIPFPKLPDTKSITPETCVRLINGEFKEHYDEYYLVDCRFPYEYNGGHIVEAINAYTLEIVKDVFMKNPIQKRVVIVFYCEFSSQRGPDSYRHLRQLDRDSNTYPNLFYPEIYLLEGGYKRFFEALKTQHCEPPQYTPMMHKDYRDERKTNMQEMRQRKWKNNKSQSLSGSMFTGSCLEQSGVLAFDQPRRYASSGTLDEDAFLEFAQTPNQS